MTQEQKRIKLCEFAGWKGIVPQFMIGYAPYRKEPYSDRVNACPVNDLDCIPLDPLPDYFSDLNAVHELEEILEDCEIKWADYRRCLIKLIEPHRHELHATASQRCEALGLTLNLWKQ